MSITSIRNSAVVFQPVGQAGRAGRKSAVGEAGVQQASGLAAAIDQTLAQVGMKGVPQKQAVASFMHSLFDALQSQNPPGSANAVSSPGAIQSRLQSLILQLSSPSAGANPANAALQQDFQNLLNAQGASGTTLGSFLQALSQNLQGINPAGNLVNTRG